MIRKIKSSWVLYSHKGKRLGTFASLTNAKKRERQINYFKNLKGGF